MQKELQDGRAALMNERLECVDLLEPLSHHVIRYPPMDVGNQHVLVIRAVEDADLALGRRFLMHAPEEIMPQFLQRGSFEGHDFAALRTHTGHHILDRPVLAADIHSLQHDEHRTVPLA